MATIVVVEDQPDNLKLITALLALKGHRVVGLHSGDRLVATLPPLGREGVSGAARPEKAGVQSGLRHRIDQHRGAGLRRP